MTFNKTQAPVFPFVRVAVLISGGIGFCLYLIYLSYFSEAGRFCEIFGTDCTSVIHSAYGSFGGISTATLGLSYFVFQLLFLLGLKRVRVDAPEIITVAAFMLSSAGFAFSLYFIYLLKAVLKQSCFACYGVHFINAALFVEYLVRFIGARRRRAKLRLTTFFLDPKCIAAGVFSLLIALNVAFGASLLEARYHLAAERRKLQENLQYHQYLYQSSNYQEFEIAPTDIVVGEKGVAIHQIVMLFKDNCDHCRKAKETLSALVREHEMAIYLVLKNVKDFTPDQLEKLQVTKTPAIFIDGKLAVGWEMPGFLDEFTED